FTNRQVELDWPQDPFLDLIVNAAMNKIAPKVPKLDIIKTGVDLANILDPKLRKTLTALHQQLEDRGLLGDDLTKIISKVSELQGHKVRLHYADGVGNTFVEVVDDKDGLPPSVIHDITDRASPLLDLFILQATEKKKVGDNIK